jgi:hypothetical protein
MLFEILATVLSAGQAIDNNDASRQASDNQLRAAQIQKADHDAQRKHETTMAIINGVLDFINSCDSENNNQ